MLVILSDKSKTENDFPMEFGGIKMNTKDYEKFGV